MNISIRPLSIFAIGCLLIACRHGDPTGPPPTCHYDSSVDEMKNWYYFKTGSWWVYQEQTTGDLDTVTVYYDWAGFNTSGTEGFEWYAHSSFDGFDYFYVFNSSFSIHCLAQEECTCHKVKRAKGKSGNFVGEGWIFLFPLIEGNYNNISGYPNGQNTAGTTTVTNTDLSFLIPPDTIPGVVRWEVSTDQSIAGWPSVYLLVQNIGIVQMEFPHTNEYWKLIEYQIIQ